MNKMVNELITAGVDLTKLGYNAFNNKRNFDLQKENLAYQKDLQQQIFRREDTAVARRMQDLINAGLSPTLATGSGANAGSVVSTNAPQNESAFVGSALDYLNAYNNSRQADATFAKTQEEVALLKTQIANMNAQTIKLNIDNGFLSQMRLAELSKMYADTDLSKEQKNKIAFDLKKLKATYDNDIALSNQSVLAGNMQNWQMGYDSYFMQQYGYKPSSLTSLPFTFVDMFVKGYDRIFHNNRGDEIYNNRPMFKLF